MDIFSNPIWQDILVAAGILLVTAFLMYLWHWPKKRRWKKKYNAAQSSLNTRTDEYNELSKRFEQVNAQAEADKNLLSNRVNSLQGDKDSLSSQLTSLQSSHATQKQTIQTLEGYKSQLDTLQVDYDTKSKLIPKLEQEGIDLQSKIANLNAELDQYKGKAVELNSLQKQYQDLTKESESAAKNAAKNSGSLEKKIAQLEAENAKLNQRYQDDIAKGKANLEAEKSKANQRFEEAKAKADQLLGNEKNKLTQKIGTHETTIAEQKGLISSLKTIEQKYLSMAPEMEKLQIKYDALLPKRASFEEDINNMQGRLTQLEASKQQLTQELASSKVVNDLLKAEIDELRLFKNQFKDGNIGSELAELNTKIRNLESHNHKVSLQLDRADQDKKDLEKQLSILDFQKAEYDRLADEKAHFADEVSKLKTDLSYVEQTKADLIVKFENLQRQKADKNRNQDIVDGYRAKFNEATTKNESLKRELTYLREQLSNKDAASTKLSANLNSLQTANEQLNQELRKVKDNLTLTDDKDGLQKRYADLSTEKEELCLTINHLENEKGQLNQKLNKLVEQLEDQHLLKDQLSSLNEEKTQLTSQVTELQASLPDGSLGLKNADLQQKLDEVVQKLADRGLELRNVSDENKVLKTELSKLKNTMTASYSAEPEKEMTEKEKELAKLRAKAESGFLDFSRIGSATLEQKDNLRKIRGIGPFFEEKLNALGIYTFQQIASFTPNDVEKVNDILEFFSGRIERDDWVGQAKRILKEK